MITKREYKELLAEARITLDDQKALKYKSMYPTWKPGVEITQDMIDSGKNRYQYDGKLYKAVTPHTTQETWEPGIDTLSLWVVIDVVHAGTADDPIPAVAGMEYEYGKYYLDGDTVYLCQRDGEPAGGKITLAYLPHDLVGQYFEAV